MEFYHCRTVALSFQEAVTAITEALKTEGFGVLTKIDMTEKLKEKLGIDFRKYVILGACNPQFAIKALQIEERIGVMLPCNVIVQQKDDQVEIATIDPVKSMIAAGNTALLDVAKDVSIKLKRALDKV